MVGDFCKSLNWCRWSPIMSLNKLSDLDHSKKFSTHLRVKQELSTLPLCRKYRYACLRVWYTLVESNNNTQKTVFISVCHQLDIFFSSLFWSIFPSQLWISHIGINQNNNFFNTVKDNRFSFSQNGSATRLHMEPWCLISMYLSVTILTGRRIDYAPDI